MDASDRATLDVIPIGPSSFLGRIVAVNVLTCDVFRQLVLLLRAKLEGKITSLVKILQPVLRHVIYWLNPRTPHFLLGSMLLSAWLLRRLRQRTVKEEISYRRKFWEAQMKAALTYDEWAYAAGMMEKYQGRKRDSDLYDEDLIQAKLDDLKERRLKGGVEDIVYALRTDLLRNLGNMCNPELHKGRLQTPKLIQEYINEVRYHLRAVCDSNSEEFPLSEKLAFMHETRHAHGRTALLLSGGAALGSFHLGVVRTLVEHRVFPRVLSGASVGSVICSFGATRTWEELQTFFDDPLPPMHFFESMGSIFATAHRLLTRGAIQEIGQLQRKMRQLIGDLTFQEAYELSGRVLCITVCSVRPQEPHRVLNYLTSPHVVIWSAVTASCAFPGLFEAQELMAKDRLGRLVPYHMPTETCPKKPCPIRSRPWRDGSLESDLPMKELKEMFNVNHFIVSQANPHIAPLLRLKQVCRAYGGDWAAKVAQLIEMELKHRCNQALAMGWRLGGLAKLFSQEWEGDITIVMPATLAQFAQMLQNPTPSELRKAVQQGRTRTWEKMSAIQANCGIELMLDECVSDLNRRRKLAALNPDIFSGQPGQQFGQIVQQHESSFSRSLRQAGTKRIPSWNCLARESSWRSFEEEGLMSAQEAGNVLGNAGASILSGPGTSGQHLGGQWGPSKSYRRLARFGGTGGNGAGHGGGHNHDGSDSDSGTEGVEMSWTRAGGPFMKSPSALKLSQQFIDAMHHERKAAAGSEAAEAGDAEKDSEEGAEHKRKASGEHKLEGEKSGIAAPSNSRHHEDSTTQQQQQQQQQQQLSVAPSIPILCPPFQSFFPQPTSLSPPYYWRPFAGRFVQPGLSSYTSLPPDTNALSPSISYLPAPACFEHGVDANKDKNGEKGGGEEGKLGEEDEEQGKIFGLVMEGCMHRSSSQAVENASMRSVLPYSEMRPVVWDHHNQQQFVPSQGGLGGHSEASTRRGGHKLGCYVRGPKGSAGCKCGHQEMDVAMTQEVSEDSRRRRDQNASRGVSSSVEKESCRADDEKVKEGALSEVLKQGNLSVPSEETDAAKDKTLERAFGSFVLRES